MGIFRPKLSLFQLKQIQLKLKQLNESANLINTTVKPAIFFGRLNFIFDILLELMQYEKFKVLKGSPPSKNYQETLKHLDKTVTNFIDRTFQNEISKINELKTEKAKQNRKLKFTESMLSAFDNSYTFGIKSTTTNENNFPRYTGSLYTKDNLVYLKQKCATLLS